MTQHQQAIQPPGTWRLFFPALVGWAFSAIAISMPGVAPVTADIGICIGLCGITVVAVTLMFRLIQKPTNSREKLVSAESRKASFVQLRNKLNRKHRLLCKPGYFALVFRRSWQLLAVAGSVLLLLSARITVEEQTRYDEMMLASVASGQISGAVEITGFIEEIQNQFGPSYQVEGRFASGSGAVPVTLRVQLAKLPSISELGIGTQVSVRGKPTARPPSSQQAYVINVIEIKLAEQHQELPASTMIHELKTGFSQGVLQLRSGLTERASYTGGAELLPGFAVGDTSLVSERLDTSMRESSLTHLVAVSGANCALITTAIMWALSWCGAGRKTRLVVAGIGLLGFVAVVGPDASVQRAAVMAAVLLSAQYGGKQGKGLPALGAAVLVLLILDPWQALQAGFALSVVATAGILIWATPLYRWFTFTLKLPSMLSLPISLAIVSAVVCAPIILLLQPGLPVMGIAANIIAAPAAPVGTALGVLALLAGPIWPAAADVCVYLGSFASSWVAATAEFVAQLGWARIYWPEGISGSILLLICEILLLTAWAVSQGHLLITKPGEWRFRTPWSLRAHPPRIVKFTVTILAVTATATIAAVTVFTPVMRQLTNAHGWAIVACDVGQGDALLLRDPKVNQEVMLVDTGDDPKKLRECLNDFGVTQISTLVLTHDDRDHVGALQSIVHLVDRAVIAPTLRAESTNSRSIVQILTQAEVETVIGFAGLASNNTVRLYETNNRFLVKTGSAIIDSDSETELDTKNSDLADSSGMDAYSSLRWQVLAPSSVSVPTERNAASLVLKVSVSDVEILLLADTGEDEQRELSQTYSGAQLQSDVVKVAHHGSGDQLAQLAELVGAQYAIISVGDGNGYGHPVLQTEKAYSNDGAMVLRTDTFGSIALVIKENQEENALHPESSTTELRQPAELRVWVQRRPETVFFGRTE